jgi:hypothetical protein
MPQRDGRGISVAEPGVGALPQRSHRIVPRIPDARE